MSRVVWSSSLNFDDVNEDDDDDDEGYDDADDDVQLSPFPAQTSTSLCSAIALPTSRLP